MINSYEPCSNKQFNLIQRKGMQLTLNIYDPNKQAEVCRAICKDYSHTQLTYETRPNKIQAKRIITWLGTQGMAIHNPSTSEGNSQTPNDHKNSNLLYSTKSQGVPCTNCGKDIPNNLNFCGYCGTAKPSPRFHCGVEMPANFHFCGICGADLEQKEQKKRVPYSNQESPNTEGFINNNMDQDENVEHFLLYYSELDDNFDLNSDLELPEDAFD